MQRAVSLAVMVAMSTVLFHSVPAVAAADSLVLQADAASTGPGGKVTVTVSARVFPDGKTTVAVRASDVTITLVGGGSVTPAGKDTGETRWTYTAPATVAADFQVMLEARLRFAPDAAGTMRLDVKAPIAPKPALPVVAEEDEEGDLVDGAEATAAPAVGSLVTVVKWRARQNELEGWNDRVLPGQGEDFVAPGLIQEVRFRVTEKNTQSVEVQWWRADRPKKVRTLNPKNSQLELSVDQDGFTNGRFLKTLPRDKGEYVFSVVVVTKDGRTLRENLTILRDRPAKEGKR
jgi:hypothetical protein